jgi:hypothetical protein
MKKKIVYSIEVIEVEANVKQNLAGFARMTHKIIDFVVVCE